MNWIVRVYDGESIVEQWTIADRTEQQASREAESEVERQYPGMDWTLSEHTELSHVVQTGSAFAGDLTLYGPFPCFDSALEYAENSGAKIWEIVPVNSPKSLIADFGADSYNVLLTGGVWPGKEA